MVLKIGFLENKLTIRGTTRAMFDYAHYNELILKNKSIIITRRPQDFSNTTIQTYDTFNKRFTLIYYKTYKDINIIVKENNLDILYIIKSGSKEDKLYTTECKCVIHCVFDTSDFHGNVYSPIAESLNKIFNTNYPVVPHMLSIPNHNEDLRLSLNIPKNANVFGYYGGEDSFNIIFVIELILEIKIPDIYFLFMNIMNFCEDCPKSNIIFLPGTNNEEYKRKFINTCDALLHARDRGESFGITCGEFAICNKPVITYGKSPETNHIELLGDQGIIYNNKSELYNILINFIKYKTSNTGYHKHTNPDYIMNIFKKVFID
jgi:glycosyltransferase involved in cell wall biosynthesis